MENCCNLQVVKIVFEHFQVVHNDGIDDDDDDVDDIIGNDDL